MTPRYKIRTLLILLAILPPLLAAGWWKYSAWKAERERQKAQAAERDRARQVAQQQVQLAAMRAKAAAVQVTAARATMAEIMAEIEAGHTGPQILVVPSERPVRAPNEL